jgi:hypothetical protein
MTHFQANSQDNLTPTTDVKRIYKTKHPYEQRNSYKNSDGILITGNSSYDPSRKSSAMVSQSDNFRVSRYHENFIELLTLGRGEYGKVVKCQNRIDG